MDNIKLSLLAGQINANMQSHMRGYETNINNEDYELLEEKECKKVFDKLSRMVGYYLYSGISGNHVFYNDLKSFKMRDGLHRFVMSYDNIVMGLEYKNAQLLNNSQENIKQLGNYTIKVGELRKVRDKNRVYHDSRFIKTERTDIPEFKHEEYTLVDIGMSYIAGKSAGEPNIIRIGITENKENNTEFVNGYIDVCSNGEINVHDFEKVNYNIKEDPNSKTGLASDSNGDLIYSVTKKEINIEDSLMLTEQINGLNNYFMDTFECANLKTNNKTR